MPTCQTGGGIIILAVNPNGEKGDPNSLVFIKGSGIDLISTLSTSFASNNDLRDMAKHALFFSTLIPEGLLNKKE